MAMIENVSRMFKMRRNEILPASILFFYLFLVMGAYLMGQAAGDALFLQEFPEQLPYAMIGSAFMAAAFVAVYSRLSTRLRLESLVIYSLIFFAASFAAFWYLTQLHIRWVYWLVLVWVYTAGAICPMMGWTLANYTLNTREARRLFGFIGAGALLGGAIVSFTAADMARHHSLEPQTALLAMSVLLFACALLVRLLFHSAEARLADHNRLPAAGGDAPQSFGGSLKTIRGSRYLLLITALVAVGCLATCILGYQFKLLAKAHYGDDTMSLTAFFCRFNGYMGLASFVFQAALTPLLLAAGGIRITLFITPFALGLSSLGVLVWPGIQAASILRGSHYLLRFSVDKSSTELLYLPVSPEARSQVKSFIDSFVYRSADGIAGLTLMLFANFLKFAPQQVSFVILACLAAWVYIANQVRREYLNVLRQAIESRTLDPERTAAQILDLTTIEVLANTLENRGEQQLMYGMRLFEMSRHTGWHPALRKLLDHRSAAVRYQALRLLGDAGDREILPQVEKLLGDESLEVRAEALRYLVTHAHRDPIMLLNERSPLPTHVIQGAVVTYLARCGDQDFFPAAQLILETMLSDSGPDAVTARSEAARILGMIPLTAAYHSHLLQLLHDPSPDVVEQALLSAGKSRAPEMLPVIIEKLAHPQLVAAARSALVQYDLRAVGVLRSYLNNDTISLSVRRQVPQTLARIKTAKSADALAHSLLQRDPALRHEIVKALNQLRTANPDWIPKDVNFADLVNAEFMGYCRSLQILAAFDGPGSQKRSSRAIRGCERLLRRAFREHMESELEQIFGLLALFYPQRDIHIAFAGLQSGRPQLQANALEMLEHLLEPELFRRLKNVLDTDIPAEDRLAFVRQICGAEVRSRNESLRMLMRSEDCWLRTCALYAAGVLELTELLPDMQTVPCGHDPLLVETRAWALARLSMSAR